MNTTLVVWPLPSPAGRVQCTTTVSSLCHVIHGRGEVEIGLFKVALASGPGVFIHLAEYEEVRRHSRERSLKALVLVPGMNGGAPKMH